MHVPSGISFNLISLGCFKNQTDSERANGMLIRAGFTPTDSPDEADIIIINTCGFIEDAKSESIETILDAADICGGHESEVFGEGKLVVAGCLSKRYMDDLKSDMTEIDLVYGLIDDNFVKTICETFDIDYEDSDDESRILLVPSPYEYIKISDGCSNNCSYCAIPLIRGGHSSYPVDSVLADAALALRRGAKELVLIAQDITQYNSEGGDLIALVKRIASLESGHEFWVRLLYCHPDHVTDGLIDLIATEPKVVPYLELPFQHANKELLASMNRKGSGTEYLELIRKMRAKVPDIALRSTFIVGYPGETDEQFKELCAFAKEAELDRGGVFIYSQEEGTKAASLEDLPHELKVERYNTLSAIVEEGMLNRLSSRVGKKVRVLVEEESEGGLWIGRSEYDAPEVDGVFFLTGQGLQLNTIVEATVTEQVDFDLAGSL